MQMATSQIPRDANEASVLLQLCAEFDKQYEAIRAVLVETETQFRKVNKRLDNLEKAVEHLLKQKRKS